MEDDIAWLKNRRGAIEDELWRVQLQQQPDSRRVPLSEVLREWAYEFDPLFNSRMRKWEEEVGRDYTNVEEYRLARAWQRDKLEKEHALHMVRSICSVLTYPVFVFFECGKDATGTYQQKGCRYGIRPLEYLSDWNRM